MPLSRQELERLQKMSFFEKSYQGVVAGVDEAGRGPLAGPVVAAACILKKGFLLKDLNDSKQLTPSKRKALYQQLAEDQSVIFSVALVEAWDIDELNILQATLIAMKRAVEKLQKKPNYVLVDGREHPLLNIPAKGIIKGDSLSISIAAASIIAKQTRDTLMEEYHQIWPEYDFLSHKGYGTKKHIEAIKRYGPCKIHRFSFEPIKSLKKYLKKSYRT